MSFFGDRVLPTKINLIRLRSELKTLKRIRRVLEEKRDVLILYVRQTSEEYKRAYEEAANKLMEAYKLYMSGLSTTGLPQAEAAAEEVPPSTMVDIGTRVMFAVKVPEIKLLEHSIPDAPSSVARLSPSIIEARRKLLEAFEALLRVVEIEYSLRRLLAELKDTQRQINTLDNVIIPRTEQNIKYIKLVLDDRMREEVIRLKMIKKRLERKRMQASGSSGGLA